MATIKRFEDLECWSTEVSSIVEQRRNNVPLVSYFSANREHPLFIDIHNLVIKTAGLVDVFENA